MPRNSNRSTAQRARKGAVKRKAGPGTVRSRQRRAAQPQAPAPFAASLSALKLSAKVGIEVGLTLKGKRLEDEPLKMLNGLLASYMAAEKAWGFITELPAELADHSDIPKAIGAVTKQFRKRFCRDGIDFIVEEDGDGYHFILFRECPYSVGWRMLEARNLLYTCSHISKACVEIAYSFLLLLQQKAGMETWYGGSFDMDFEYMKDRSFEEWSDDDDEPVAYAADLKAYKTGQPGKAATAIRKAAKLSPDQIIKRLTRISKQHDVIDRMILMCELMRQPYTIQYFDNHECDYEINHEDGCFLYFSQAFSVIWAFDDSLGCIHREMLDAEWNSGSVPAGAFATFDVTPGRKDWSLEEFNASVSWPKEFSDRLTKLNDACEEPANKKQANALVNILV